MSLQYDPSFMLLPRRDAVEPFLRKRMAALERARMGLHHQRSTRFQGWFDLPGDRSMIKQIRALVEKTKHFETLLVLGIGGSDLGTKAIFQALPSNKHVVFAGDTTDPDALTDVLSLIDLKKTLVNIVCKSGETIETMSSFLIVRDKLKKLVGAKFIEQIVATTDPEEGTLAEWTRREGYHHLPIPKNVGGRFSVLSVVGMFPAAWAGIPFEKILNGAAQQMKSFEKDEAPHQLPAMYAALHADAYLHHGRTHFVFMPYASSLSTFALWYRQLIAESLGKEKNRSGLSVSIGPTAIAGIGAADQHSQLQLYMEGPADKCLTFLEVEQFQNRITVPAPPFHSSSFVGIEGRSLQELIHAERQCTAEALAARNRPSGTLFISKIDPSTLGELFQFFMLATAYLGELFDVNAYDQPGVQDGKRRFREWMRNQK